MSSCMMSNCCAPDKCSNIGSYPVNYSGYHKLCEAHLYLLQQSSFHQCGHCDSIYLITGAPPDPLLFCPICLTRPLPDPQSSACELCLQICSKCNKISADLKMTQCHLKLCLTCFESETCCNYSCVICKTHEKTYSLECGKTMCEKCYFSQTCCQNFCWNCRAHKNFKSECGKIMCNTCEIYQICCEDLCSRCKNQHCYRLEKSGELVCNECQIKLYQENRINISRDFQELGSMNRPQALETNQEYFIEEKVATEDIMFLPNQKYSEFQVNAFENYSKDKKIEEEKFHSSQYENQNLNNNYRLTHFSMKKSQILDNNIDDHSLKDEKKGEQGSDYVEFDCFGTSIKNHDIEGKQLEFSSDKTFVKQNNKPQVFESSKKTEDDLIKYKDLENHSLLASFNPMNRKPIERESIESIKSDFICSMCDKKGVYEYLEGIILCDPCYNGQFLQEISVNNCEKCHKNLKNQSFNENKQKFLCDDCNHEMNSPVECINCNQSKSQYKLKCDHSICESCFNKTGEKCSFCDSEYVRCEICGYFAYKKVTFEICGHRGCENCKSYKYCFNCIQNIKKKKLKKKLELKKGKYFCISCEKKSNYEVSLICKDKACLTCFMDLLAFDYCCNSCYFNNDFKVCFSCKNEYILTQDMKKSCCNKVIKYEKKFSFLRLRHYKMTLQNH